MGSSPLSGSVSTAIAANPQHVWEVVSGRRSPVGPLGGRWRDGTRDSNVSGQFSRNVVREGACPIYWKNLTVLENEPGHRFAFTGDLPWRTASTWRYDMRSDATGCVITESYELVDAWYYRFYALFAHGYRTRHHHRGGVARLEHVKRAAESPPGQST